MALGLASLLPWHTRAQTAGAGGTASARYCYSVWLRHLVLAREHGYADTPRHLVEIGPGATLGVGLAALLSGAEQYDALDLIPFVASPHNLAIFDELLDLFRREADIPAEDEFPAVRPLLPSYAFPRHILPRDLMSETQRPARLRRIRHAIEDPTTSESIIRYHAPWTDGHGLLPLHSCDMILSQAVLQHVDDLAALYGLMASWVTPGGLMSHTVNYASHGMAQVWNGHWEYAETTWRMMRGRRPYLINREPHSTHRRLLDQHGFAVIGQHLYTETGGLTRDRLSPRFRTLSDEDLVTSGAFIQARKAR